MVALTVTPTAIYYVMSYNSVNGTHPELVAGYRETGFCSATFLLTIHVWSWAGSLDTQVSNPVFVLSVDDLGFGTQAATGGTFQPNNYVSYPLTFKVSDCGISRAVRSSNSNRIVLQMTADVSSGIFREQ